MNPVGCTYSPNIAGNWTSASASSRAGWTCTGIMLAGFAISTPAFSDAGGQKFLDRAMPTDGSIGSKRTRMKLEGWLTEDGDSDDCVKPDDVSVARALQLLDQFDGLGVIPSRVVDDEGAIEFDFLGSQKLPGGASRRFATVRLESDGPIHFKVRDRLEDGPVTWEVPPAELQASITRMREWVARA